MPSLFKKSTALAWMVALSACIAAGAVQAKAKPRRHGKSMPDKTPHAVIYGQRDDVMRFATEAAIRQELDVDATRAVLAKAKYIPTVARLIMPPPAGTAKNWGAYLNRFVEPTRLKAAAAFWTANQAWLRLAEERYGVPPEIIVGIVGVETIYGQQMGSFRIIDALATLSFDFPKGRKDRSPFFRDELESYLLLCKQEGVDPLSWRGSYAGAIGMPQFMPSSILKHAVDFDADGHIDLHNNPADVIGSVANFLANHGWQRGMPTRFDVSVPVDTAERALLLVPDILPSFTPQEFVSHGAVLADEAMTHPGKLALVELQNGDAAPTYVAGTENFYAITRYNWSSYYALAVISLGEAIKRMQPPKPVEPPAPANPLPENAPAEMAASPVLPASAAAPSTPASEAASPPASSASPASSPASGVPAAAPPPAEPASP